MKLPLKTRLNRFNSISGLEDAEGRSVCQFQPKGIDPRISAAHIVHCVNSHPALVSENKRLREALKEIAGMDIRYSGTNNVAVAATDTARAALAKEDV